MPESAKKHGCLPSTSWRRAQGAEEGKCVRGQGTVDGAQSLLTFFGSATDVTRQRADGADAAEPRFEPCRTLTTAESTTKDQRHDKDTIRLDYYIHWLRTHYRKL